ncbi:MAG: hypothetical protein NC911_03860 [Candidatus Omnitrophica bacterium]|nr:hypothetical protein [Candidatus Omnitrophota bacterium]MCM8768803.1 hypothetical protein [Candidatus Omnitrophota bacterium]
MVRERIFQPLRELGERFWSGLARVIGALLIFLFGWIIARLVRVLLIKFFRLLKLDNLVEDSGLKTVLDKGNVTSSPSELLATGVYWLLMLVVVFIAINFAGIEIPATVIDSLLSFIPKFILGLLVFVFAMFLGNLLGEIVRTSAANAGMEKAVFLGKLTRGTITTFGIVVALQEIGIAAEFIGNVFIVILASFCFGLALAFALGAKDIVRSYLEDWTKKR